MLKLYKLKDYNFLLMFLLIVISLIGVVLVGSADPTLRSRQLMGFLLGLVLMVVISLIDYSWILHFYWIIYSVRQLLAPRDGLISEAFSSSRPSCARS